jgi:hypothetical protein
MDLTKKRDLTIVKFLSGIKKERREKKEKGFD